MEPDSLKTAAGKFFIAVPQLSENLWPTGQQDTWLDLENQFFKNPSLFLCAQLLGHVHFFNFPNLNSHHTYTSTGVPFWNIKIGLFRPSLK